jgi:uncharacterized membrane protein
MRKLILSSQLRFIALLFLAFFMMGSLPLAAAAAQDSEAVVEVILYWEAGCPACEIVLNETIPPLQDQYKDRLKVSLKEVVSLEDVDSLYRLGAAYGLAREQVSIPLLIIGETVLVGSEQIPSRLPGLIDSHLASGGVATVARDPQALQPIVQESGEPLWSGMPLAWVLSAFMLVSLGFTVWQVGRAFQGHSMPPVPTWLDRSIPVLALAGLGVAVYMTYIEATYTPAVCGPIGDCNAVQTSPYARLFGVVPVGLFGAAGFLAILGAWLWHRLHGEGLSAYMPAAILGLTVFGTLFSVYLTYLEIFIIKAVCIWCLSSALIITLLMLAGLPAAANWLAVTEGDE